jgi:hypothetical protein
VALHTVDIGVAAAAAALFGELDTALFAAVVVMTVLAVIADLNRLAVAAWALTAIAVTTLAIGVVG